MYLDVVFYRTESGTEPVRDWLKGLPRVDKRTIGCDIKTVQFGWPLGMPVVRKVERDLWEIRSRLDKRIARVLFTVQADTMILLHGFIKKSQRSPRWILNSPGSVRRSWRIDMGKHVGSKLDDFLDEEGLLAESEAVAVKRVIACQLREMMKQQGLSKTALAGRMKTSRASLERLLDPDNASVTLLTLERAAMALGLRVRIELAAA